MVRRLIGLVAAAATLVAGPIAVAQTYRYDVYGRVIEVDHPYTSSTKPGSKTTYSYDAANNRAGLSAVPNAGAVPGGGSRSTSLNRPATNAEPTIAPGAAAPVCRSARVVASGDPHVVPISAFCTDADGDPLRILAASTSTRGARAVINPDQTVTVFGVGSVGEVVLQFVVADPRLNAGSGTLTIVRA